MKKFTFRCTRPLRAGVAFAGCVAVLAFAAACGRKTPQGEHFGAPFTTAPTTTIRQLQETPEAFRRKPVRVQGVIERQCPASGCWFFLRDEQGGSIKVELGDYLPKLPMNLGNVAEVEGEWIPKGNTHEFIGTRVTFTPTAKERP